MDSMPSELAKAICDIVGWEYPSHGQRRIDAAISEHIAPLEAENERLKSVTSRLLICGDCKVPYDVSIDKDPCGLGHEADWAHDWRTKREHAGWDKYLLLESAIREHRDQKADDRCWMDDQKLYAVLGDGNLGDNTTCDPCVMLDNCKRFIERRMQGGNWPSYQALETSLAASQAECERLRSFGRKQQDEIETLNGYADAVERLREIGKATGCGHVDDPDGRRQLVNCVTQTIYDLENKIAATDEGPVAKWNCAAQRQGTAGGNEPAECNFPFCGCDPRAADVVEAIKESGWLSPEELCREREMSAADNAAIRQQVARLCADAAESDHDIRELAKRVLPASQVDGNRECVPPLVEVVAAVVALVEKHHSA